MGQRAGAAERRGQSGATRAAVGHRRGKRGQRVQRVGFGHALEPLKHFISRLGVAGGQRGGGRGQQGQRSGMHWSPSNFIPIRGGGKR